MIETERGQGLADEYGIKFMETSAKNSINVDKAFISLAKDIKVRMDNEVGGQATTKSNDDGGVISVQGGASGGNQDKGACGC